MTQVGWEVTCAGKYLGRCLNLINFLFLFRMGWWITCVGRYLLLEVGTDCGDGVGLGAVGGCVAGVEGGEADGEPRCGVGRGDREASQSMPVETAVALEQWGAALTAWGMKPVLGHAVELDGGDREASQSMPIETAVALEPGRATLSGVQDGSESVCCRV